MSDSTAAKVRQCKRCGAMLINATAKEMFEHAKACTGPK